MGDEMDATALRARTHAVTPKAATTTAGANDATGGGGAPRPAATSQGLVGMHLLQAPSGAAPGPIQLGDGSVLVPLARVERGIAVPLAPGSPAVAAAAPPTIATPFEPKGFLYDDRYFAKFHDAAPIDLADRDSVERRAAKATMSYLVEEEPGVDDFGVTAITMRRADPIADRDLLTIDPRAHWIIDVAGVRGDGTPKSIPSIMNSDGAVFVDPRIGRT